MFPTVCTSWNVQIQPFDLNEGWACSSHIRCKSFAAAVSSNLSLLARRSSRRRGLAFRILQISSSRSIGNEKQSARSLVRQERPPDTVKVREVREGLSSHEKAWAPGRLGTVGGLKWNFGEWCRTPKKLWKVKKLCYFRIWLKLSQSLS